MSRQWIKKTEEYKGKTYRYLWNDKHQFATVPLIVDGFEAFLDIHPDEVYIMVVDGMNSIEFYDWALETLFHKVKNYNANHICKIMELVFDYLDKYDKHIGAFELYGDKYLYSGSADDGNYFYKTIFKIGKQQYRLIVTGYGVSLDVKSKNKHTPSITTNITPKTLFPDQKVLTKENIKHILKLVIDSGAEGKKYSAEYMKKMYKKWKALGKP